MSQEQESDNDGLDVASFGKIAKAIPSRVYERSATVILTTFQQLIAPLTETTSGLGRYIRQKFDNMVEAEKAIETYTLEKAVVRARAHGRANGSRLTTSRTPKDLCQDHRGGIKRN